MRRPRRYGGRPGHALILAMTKLVMANFALLLAGLCFTEALLAQGETTSAIVGAVADPAGGAIRGGAVTLVSADAGSKRIAITDDAGRFSFPQLKPGAYSVKAEAEGFEVQENHNVVAGLGQTQTVTFALDVA